MIKKKKFYKKFQASENIDGKDTIEILNKLCLDLVS